MKLKIITCIGFLLLAMIVACQSVEEQEFKRYYSGGSLIYQAHCQNCHGANGEGLNGLIPPLKDSTYLKTNKTMLACVIKYGAKGKVTISDKLYEGEMPASDLAPIEIAKALTYITNSFGNKLGIINSEQVEADLRSCR